MARRGWQLMGLVVDEHALRVADGAGHTAEVVLPGQALPDADETGQALRRAMDEAGVRGQAVLVGVPGRWLAVRPRIMPPATGDALAGAVRMAAEREFPGQADQLIIDYTPDVTTTEAPQLLLCALPADRINWLRTMTAAARLRLTAITPTAAATPTEGLTLHLAPGRCELSCTQGGQLHLLRHLGGSLNGVASSSEGPHDLDADTRILTAEIRRTLTMLDRPATTLHIDDAIGLEPHTINRIGEQLSLTVHQPAAITATTPRFAPARRLAEVDPDKLPINFVTARTKRAPQRQLSRPMRIGLLVGVLALLLVGGYTLDLYQRHRTIAEHRQWQARHAAQLDRASLLRDDLGVARGWLEERPRHLDTLLALTLAFPERGDVWATNLTLNDGGTGVVTGRARNERDVLDLLDRLQDTADMDGAKLVYVREADARTREVSFAINLTSREGGR